jgi:uncharacterized protein (TIGR02001 family)
MKAIKLALCAAAACVSMGGAAMAQEVAITGNVGIVSDYVFRGVSQTLEDPAIQGGVDLTAGMFYAGAWASNVDFGTTTDAEIDVYAGLKPELAGFTFDFAAIYYGYIDSPAGPEEAYWEFKGAVSRPFGPLTLGGAVFYSPEFYLETGETWYYEANAAFAFSDTFSMSGAIGEQTYQDLGGADYTTWNVGATWAFAPHLSADLRYHDTDLDIDLAEERVVIGIKAVFP